VYAPLSASIYMKAGEDLIWVGPDTSPPHPRAVLCAGVPPRALAEPPSLACHTVSVDVARVVPWRPWEGPRTAVEASAMVAGAGRLAARLRCLGLADIPPFPLEHCRDRARALAEACVRDDPTAGAAAAVALLGLGPGLTPSGDDFAGAAFFARILLARAGAADRQRWRTAADRVLAAAPALTHPISVALLGDLLDGCAYGPLHDLAHVLATSAPAAVADDAARALVRIGHASGSDMLSGFIAGCGFTG